jgi:transcriptional regulator with XRE-family HTH domain
MADGPSSFAGKLRQLRENAGFSQYALAKRSGLSKQALSRLEMGEREPSWETVQKLALALRVDSRQFVDPAVTIPTEEEAAPGKPGRPRKEPTPEADAPRLRKGK